MYVSHRRQKGVVSRTAPTKVRHFEALSSETTEYILYIYISGTPKWKKKNAPKKAENKKASSKNSIILKIKWKKKANKEKYRLKIKTKTKCKNKQTKKRNKINATCSLRSPRAWSPASPPSGWPAPGPPTCPCHSCGCRRPPPFPPCKETVSQDMK